MTIILTLIGLAVGAFLGVPGAVLGAGIGFAIGRLQEISIAADGLGDRVDQLARLTAEVHRRAQKVGLGGDVAQATGEGAALGETEATGDRFAPGEVEASGERLATGDFEATREREFAARREAARLTAAMTDFGALLQRGIAWITGGNTLARVAMLILFVGFAFLVKYAVDNALLSIQLRMLSAGASGLALYLLGWRLRAGKRDFGLTLQGGGLAVLYLSVYGSFYLYDLIPGPVAFGLMALISIVTGAVAVRQEAQILALVAVLGGFAAPMLASRGDGSTLMLFSYYAVLNFGVLGISWMRPWRSVTLVGLLCTFGLAGMWGGLSYQSSDYSIAQPFLIGFFLQYIAILLLATRHRNPQVGRLMDGALVFGLPLAAFTLQAGLVIDFEYGLAWSALAVGLFYTTAAAGVYRRVSTATRVLFEAFLGTGLAFLTMAIPFALDAPWSGAGWALEGAALVWLGTRQQEYRLRWAGVGLQLIAGLMLLDGLGSIPDTPPVFNGELFGFLCLALSAGFSSFLYIRRTEPAFRLADRVGSLLHWLAAAWWTAGGLLEIERIMDAIPAVGWGVGYLALTASGLAILSNRLRWPALREPARLLTPVLFVALLHVAMAGSHPLVGVGALTWLAALATVFGLLIAFERHAKHPISEWLFAAAVWLTAIVASWEVVHFVDQLNLDGQGWMISAVLIVPILIIWALSSSARPIAERGWLGPNVVHALLTLGVVPILGLGWAWAVVTSGISSADAAPLAYLPILNPMDLVLLVGVWVAIVWTRETIPDDSTWVPMTRALLMVSVFVFLNATLARSVHFLGEVSFAPSALFQSGLYQTTTSIVWTLAAVGLMIASSRRASRSTWIVGASLLGLVVLKLFLVDLGNTSTVTRIVSFIVVGLLILVVAYLTPIPPPREDARSSA